MDDNFDLTTLISEKKKRKNSRAKGNTFENKVCKILNEAFSTDEFMRAPGSGAFSTTHKLPKHLQMSGDLITPSRFKFTIECKFGYNKENLGSLFNPKSDFSSFLIQAKGDAKRVNREFMLIFKQNNREILCVIEKDKDYYLSKTITNMINYIELNIKKESSCSYLICNLEELLKLDVLSSFFS